MFVLPSPPLPATASGSPIEAPVCSQRREGENHVESTSRNFLAEKSHVLNTHCRITGFASSHPATQQQQQPAARHASSLPPANDAIYRHSTLNSYLISYIRLFFFTITILPPRTMNAFARSAMTVLPR